MLHLESVYKIIQCSPWILWKFKANIKDPNCLQYHEEVPHTHSVKIENGKKSCDTPIFQRCLNVDVGSHDNGNQTHNINSMKLEPTRGMKLYSTIQRLWNRNPRRVPHNFRESHQLVLLLISTTRKNKKSNAI